MNLGNDVAVLQTVALCRSFRDARGGVAVLRDVDFSIARGEFVIVTGPSGSGKTTFLNIAALLDQPTSGDVIFDGRRVSWLSESEMCEMRALKVGMVFQKFHLLPHRTAFQNVLFRWRYVASGAEGSEAAAEAALHEVGLGDIRDRPARLLSAGEMQRVAIARAVALPPRLLVADEPTGNLDTAAAELVMGCFRRLNAAGMTILMVTHNERLLDYGTRHVICRDGKLG